MAQIQKPQIQSQAVKADPKVVAYKRAAQIFCKRTGCNAEELMRRPHPLIHGVETAVPAWYCVAEEMFAFASMMQAINAAAQEMMQEAKAKTDADAKAANEGPSQSPDRP